MAEEESAKALFDKGNTKLRTKLFEEAMFIMKNASDADKKSADAYFGLALAENRVQCYYKPVETPFDESGEPAPELPEGAVVEGDWVFVSCVEKPQQWLTDNPNYYRALKHATPAQRASYKKLGRLIDQKTRETFGRVKYRHSSKLFGKLGVRIAAIGLFSLIGLAMAATFVTILLYLCGMEPFYTFYRAMFIDLWIKFVHATGAFILLPGYDKALAVWVLFNLVTFAMAAACVIKNLIKNKSIIYAGSGIVLMMLISACIVPLLGAIIIYVVYAGSKSKVEEVRHVFGFIVLVWAIYGIAYAGFFVLRAAKIL